MISRAFTGVFLALVMIVGMGVPTVPTEAASAATSYVVGDAETSSFCSVATAAQGKSLQPTVGYDGVFACAALDGDPGDFSVPAAGVSLPVPYFEQGSFGFQCTELANRFFWVHYGAAHAELPIHDQQAYAAGFAKGLVGGDYVASLAHAYGIPALLSGTGALPAAGDIISMWGTTGQLVEYGGDSHVAVVTSDPAAKKGGGWSFAVMEENAQPNKGANTIEVSSQGKWTYGPVGGGYNDYTNFQWLVLGSSAPPTSSAPAIATSVSGHVGVARQLR